MKLFITIFLIASINSVLSKEESREACQRAWLINKLSKKYEEVHYKACIQGEKDQHLISISNASCRACSGKLTRYETKDNKIVNEVLIDEKFGSEGGKYPEIQIIKSKLNNKYFYSKSWYGMGGQNTISLYLYKFDVKNKSFDEIWRYEQDCTTEERWAKNNPKYLCGKDSYDFRIINENDKYFIRVQADIIHYETKVKIEGK